MKKITNSILNFMSTRLGFVLTLLLLYWFKTMWAYSVDFNLDIQGPYQIFLAVINPLPISLLFIGLALYIKRTKLFYSLAFGIYLLLFIWLISNSIYYREFTDFVTVNTMLAFCRSRSCCFRIVPTLGCDLHSRFPYSSFLLL